jgi:acyl-CoA dehydrogenase
MVITEPDNAPYQRHSMLIVPTDTPGVNIIRNVGIAGWDHEGEGGHAYIRYEDARVPAANLLGDRGGGFVLAQTRLGGGRVHHAMRTVGMAKRALEMMLERAVSRRTQGELLSKKQLVQEMVADSWLELEQFRLLVLQTAWKIDRYHDYKRVRGDIAAVKIAMPTVLKNIASRALQVHGSLGLSDEMPFMKMIVNGYHVGLADGPTEVHKITLARGLLSQTEPSAGLFPTSHIPLLKEQALEKYADVLARHGQYAVREPT